MIDASRTNAPTPHPTKIDLRTWRSLGPCLDQALDLEPVARTAWLNSLATRQAEAAGSIRRLLAEREALNASGFLSGSPLPLDNLLPALMHMLRQDRHGTEPQQQDGLMAGAMLGPYRLQRRIGVGGTSSVWLAEHRHGQCTREVALKLPFAGSRCGLTAEQFNREREILAGLIHPNIARLYDAGASVCGQSYLAMEYVPGAALTHHCDSVRLTVRERLTLFLQVLLAVEFAHSHRVLHRDLKPANIQVSRQGRVVLLDFGSAKLLSQETSESSPPPDPTDRMLTPDYASPEHLGGSEQWTRSDVYSLGVVLFELLVGMRPFGVPRQSRRDIEEAILTRDGPPASQSVISATAAAARQSTPGKLAQLLKGDLDATLMKALRKTPAERYPSIDAFARDITRYLKNQRL